MIEHHEAMDGITYAISEVDEELTTLIPNLKRRKCTTRVMAEADALLDTRNELREIGRTMLGEVVEDFVFSDEFEYLTNGGI